MHPEQEQEIRVIAEEMDQLALSLCKHYGIDEDEGLDIVRELPGLVGKLQDRDYAGLVQEAAKRIRRPKNLKFDAPDPDEKYPFHPKFRPRVTTPTTFNEHFSQAAKPYIVAVMRRIAKDRNLEEPDAKTIQAVIDNIDWAKAAYEARSLPENPTKQQLKRVMKKLWAPVEKVLDIVPFEWAWHALLGTAVAIYFFKMLKGAFDPDDKASVIYKIMDKGFNVYARYKNRQPVKQQYKGFRNWR
jgi:signal recognition particle subunit SEC65